MKTPSYTCAIGFVDKFFVAAGEQAALVDNCEVGCVVCDEEVARIEVAAAVVLLEEKVDDGDFIGEGEDGDESEHGDAKQGHSEALLCVEGHAHHQDVGAGLFEVLVGHGLAALVVEYEEGGDEGPENQDVEADGDKYGESWADST